MCATRLDLYEVKPRGFEDYLSQYGWSFSKTMYEWAVSRMKDRNNAKLRPVDKSEVMGFLNNCGVKIENDRGYDIPYVYMMAKADHWGSAISDDVHLAMFVKDYIDDKDGYEGLPFTRFYADMIAKGIPIIWEDMI